MAALLAPTAAAVPTVPITNPESVVIRFEPVDNTPGGPALDGFVTMDIRLDIGLDDAYIGTEMLIHLQSGGFYRDALGSPVGFKPTPEDLDLSDSLAFDTYFTGPLMGSGALSLDAPPSAVFPANGGMMLNQAWSVSSTLLFGVTDYLDAKITLSEDTNGTFEYLLVTSNRTTGRDTSFRQRVITNGVFVPEPLASVFLLAMITVATPRRHGG